jgi:hypothetical protein
VAFQHKALVALRELLICLAAVVATLVLALLLFPENKASLPHLHRLQWYER